MDFKQEVDPAVFVKYAAFRRFMLRNKRRKRMALHCVDNIKQQFHLSTPEARSCRINASPCPLSNYNNNEDDIFTDEPVHTLQKTALLRVFDSEFRKLNTRSCSTSTPFYHQSITRATSRKPLKSDSCFNESKVAQIFAHSCTINTMERSHQETNFVERSRRNLSNKEDLPLPKIKLLPEFDAESEDSALGDSIQSDLSDSERSQSSLDITDNIEPSICSSKTSSLKSSHKRIVDFDESLFESVIMKFSPRNPENIIGRRMGLDHVDILTELDKRGIPCLDTILGLLDDKDLCSMSEVSQSWESICLSNKKAAKRRKAYLHNPSKGKENVSMKSVKSENKSYTSSKKGPLGSVQRSSVTNTPTSDLSTSTNDTSIHSKFWQEAEQLKNDESLCKCPKCESPSKVHQVQKRAACKNKNCQYDFCIKCHNTFHGSRPCGLLTSPVKRTRTKDTICSKKSKQRLRRL